MRVSTGQLNYPIKKRKPSINGGEIIIAERTGSRLHPYVVWRMDDKGFCEGGDYANTWDEALKHFAERV